MEPSLNWPQKALYNSKENGSKRKWEAKLSRKLQQSEAIKPMFRDVTLACEEEEAEESQISYMPW